MNQEVEKIISNDSFLKAFLFEKSKRVLITIVTSKLKNLRVDKEYYYYGNVIGASTLFFEGEEFLVNQETKEKVLFNEITFTDVYENDMFQGLKIEIL